MQLHDFTVIDWYRLLFVPAFEHSDVLPFMEMPFAGMKPWPVVDHDQILEHIFEAVDECIDNFGPLLSQGPLIDCFDRKLQFSDTALQTIFYKPVWVYEGFVQVWTSEKSIERVAAWFDEFEFMRLIDWARGIRLEIPNETELHEQGIAFEADLLSKRDRNEPSSGYVTSAAEILRGYKEPDIGFVPLIRASRSTDDRNHKDPDATCVETGPKKNLPSILDDDWAVLSPVQETMVESLSPEREKVLQVGQPRKATTNRSDHEPGPVHGLRRSMSDPNLGQYRGNMWLGDPPTPPDGNYSPESTLGRDKAQEFLIREFMRSKKKQRNLFNFRKKRMINVESLD